MNGFRGFLQRAATLFAGLASALLLLEIALRLTSAGKHDVFASIAARPSPARGENVTLGQIILPSANERIVYELRPNLDVRFVNQELVTNSLGMRSPERPLAKPAGVFRVVGIGDSMMFGWGVAQTEAYLSRLEQDLATRFPERRFEVWNLAVPGYNAVQEVEGLAAEIDELKPDLVVIGWVGNDMDLPNFLTAEPHPWSPDHSLLLDLVRSRLRARDSRTVDPGLFEVPYDEQTHRYLLRRDEIPERYWPLAGWDNMRDAYRRLAAMARERRISAVVVFVAGQRGFKKFCKEEGLSVIEAQHRVLRYEKEHGVDRHRALQLSSSDPHPNALGHQLIEEALIDGLLEARVL